MDKELPIEVTIVGYQKGTSLEWIVQGTELGGNQFIGFPAKTSLSNGTTKEQPKKRLHCQKRRSNRIDSRHAFLCGKTKKDLCAI